MPDLKGLDIHTHIPPRGGRKSDPRADQKEAYFRSPTLGMTVEDMAELYRKLGMMAVMFGIDKSTPAEQVAQFWSECDALDQELRGKKLPPVDRSALCPVPVVRELECLVGLN